jgi:hypothetical protein
MSIFRNSNFYFRNDFFQFLLLQFCGENLVFYEVAEEWKKTVYSNSVSAEDRASQVQAIFLNVFFSSFYFVIFFLFFFFFFFCFFFFLLFFLSFSPFLLHFFLFSHSPSPLSLLKENC